MDHLAAAVVQGTLVVSQSEAALQRRPSNWTHLGSTRSCTQRLCAPLPLALLTQHRGTCLMVLSRIIDYLKSGCKNIYHKDSAVHALGFIFF